MDQRTFSDRDIALTKEVEIKRRQNSSQRNYIFEFSILLLLIGNNLILTLLQNQMIKQTCLQMGYSKEACDVISQNKNETRDIEEQVQPYVANLNLAIRVFHKIFPAILALFLGNWSDIYGRKGVLISSFLSYTLTLVLLTSVCYYSDYISALPPWTYVLCYIPSIFLGGWPSLFIAALCYVADTCEQSQRSKRVTIIEQIMYCGILIGTFSCSIILSIINVPLVLFIIASSLDILACFLLIFFVDESMHVSDRQDSALQKVKTLFSPMIILNLMKTCFKRRPFKGRRILLSVMLMLVFMAIIYNGNGTVSYLFAREKFSWTLEENNFYDSYSIVCSIVGSFIGFSVVKKYFKLSDMSLACVALISDTLDSFFKAFAFESWQMYAITSFSMFRTLASPMFRTLISGIVPYDEIGKVFSISISIEELLTFLASSLYTLVYKSTFTTFSGAFFLITAALNILNILIAYYVIYLKNIRDITASAHVPFVQSLPKSKGVKYQSIP